MYKSILKNIDNTGFLKSNCTFFVQKIIKKGVKCTNCLKDMSRQRVKNPLKA